MTELKMRKDDFTKKGISVSIKEIGEGDSIKIQITIFHKEGKYRPIATTIEVSSMEDFKANQTVYVRKAITKIAQQRYQTPNELAQKGYTKYKYRKYDKRDRFIDYMVKAQS